MALVLFIDPFIRSLLALLVGQQERHSACETLKRHALAITREDSLLRCNSD